MAALEIVARRGESPQSPLSPTSSSDFFRTLLGEGPLAARLAAEGDSLLGDVRAEIDAIGRGKRQRATLGAYLEREAWELGFEADGGALLVTAYRLGPDPEVAVHERRLELATLGPVPS